MGPPPRQTAWQGLFKNLRLHLAASRSGRPLSCDIRGMVTDSALPLRVATFRSSDVETGLHALAAPAVHLSVYTRAHAC